MKGLYLASLGVADGKTALATGFCRRLVDDGNRVGFFKPLSLPTSDAADGDAQFMKEIIGLRESVETLSPIILSQSALASATMQEKEGFAQRVRNAYNDIARGKDVVVIEGVGGIASGSEVGLDAGSMAELLDVKVLVMLRYRIALRAQDIAAACDPVKEHLLGVVINLVPYQSIEAIRHVLAPALESLGIKLLGVIPEDKRLLAFTVDELVEGVKGKVLVGAEDSGELVPNILMGAMSLDPAADYLGRVYDKAVITRGDHPDIQLAALSTSLKGLILTKTVVPSEAVRYRAEDGGVLLAVTEEDTLSTIGSLETAFARARFRQAKKLGILDEILAKHLDFAALCEGLGLRL